jgi:adenylate kinase family enzyme
VRRIVVLGCGGSGKSYLARAVARHLELNLTHLDALYYDENWDAVPMEDFAAAQRRLIAESAWVIEGNYASTLPIRLAAADTVILLDLPARTCLRGIVGRHLRHGPGQEPESGTFNRITWQFVRYILGYRRRMLPRVHAAIGEHASSADVIVLRSRGQARSLLRQLTNASAAQADPQYVGLQPR